MFQVNDRIYKEPSVKDWPAVTSSISQQHIRSQRQPRLGVGGLGCQWADRGVIGLTDGIDGTLFSRSDFTRQGDNGNLPQRGYVN